MKASRGSLPMTAAKDSEPTQRRVDRDGLYRPGALAADVEEDREAERKRGTDCGVGESLDERSRN